MKQKGTKNGYKIKNNSQSFFVFEMLVQSRQF